MESDPIRMCRLLVGLPTVDVLGVVDLMPTVPLAVHVETILTDYEHCPKMQGLGTGQ